MQIRKYLNFSYMVGFVVRQADSIKALTIYLLKKDRDNIIVKPIRDNFLGKNVAIVAIWQKKLCKNLEDMLRTLRENNIKILVVNNCEIDCRSEKLLAELVDGYVERMPGNGRDIAAYKKGVAILNELDIENSPIENIFFINDSVYYIKNRFDAFLKKILTVDIDVLGVTETTELHHHLSSWFFVVNKNIFLSSGFQKFWKSYKELQSRVYSIKMGEVKLTRVYKKLGVAPHVVYSTCAIMEKIKQSKLKKSEVYRSIPRLLRGRFSMKKGVLPELLFWTKLEELSDTCNQTFYWSLVLVKYFQFPFIKKDLYSRELYSKSELESAMDVIGKSEDLEKVRYMFNSLVSRLTTSEETLVNKLLIKSGVK